MNYHLWFYIVIDTYPSSIHIYPYLSISIHIYPSSIHIYPYLSISIHIYPSSIHIYPYLSISIHIYPYLSIIYPYLSISIHIYPYLSISIHIYPYLSISIHIYPYLSISIHHLHDSSVCRAFSHLFAPAPGPEGNKASRRCREGGLGAAMDVMTMPWSPRNPQGHSWVVHKPSPSRFTTDEICLRWLGTWLLFEHDWIIFFHFYIGNSLPPTDELHHFSEGFKPPTRNGELHYHHYQILWIQKRILLMII